MDSAPQPGRGAVPVPGAASAAPGGAGTVPTTRIDELFHADTAPGARVDARAVLAGALAFGLGLALVATAITRTLAATPGTQLEVYSPQRVKLRWFAEHREDYDVVFLGSSRTARGIDPQAFEARLAAGGRDWRAFNLGMAGMEGPESLFVCDWLLDQDPARVRWLFVEAQAFDVEIGPLNHLTRRMVFWHTPAITRTVLAGVARSSRTAAEKRAAWGTHLIHALYRATNLGAFLPELFAALGFEDDQFPGHPGGDPLYTLGDDRDGFRALDEDRTRVRVRRERRESFRRDPSTLLARIDELTAERARPAAPEDFHVAAWRAFVERARARGIEVAFFRLPATWNAAHELDEALRREDGLFFADYNDPRRHAEAFGVETLFDVNHATSQGARLVTTWLARDFLRHLETAPPSERD